MVGVRRCRRRLKRSRPRGNFNPFGHLITRKPAHQVAPE
jgi:hypothetical protein